MEERLALATEMVEVAHRIGAMEMALRGHFRCFRELLELGDISAADSEIEKYTRLAKELRQPTYLWLVPFHRSSRAMMQGRFEECERLAKEALAIGERTQDQNAVMFYQLQMTILRPLQGRYGDVEEVVSKFVEKYPAQPGWRAALAAIHCELGRDEEARREFELLAANDFAAFRRQGDWLVGMAALARVCASLHDVARAEKLYELLRPFVKRHVAIGSAAVYFGPVSLYLGALAGTMSNWQDAIYHFEEALRECARLGAKPFLARCQFEYGTTLLARSKPEDREKGLALIQSSLKLATVLGMKKLIQDARASVSR